MIGEKRGRAVEAVELEALVEVRDRDGMNRLEADGDIQSAAEQRSEFECHRANRTRV